MGGVNAWVIHRWPDIFGGDVDTHRPERWREDGGYSNKETREMDRFLCQFDVGKYTCAGKNISLLEM